MYPRARYAPSPPIIIKPDKMRVINTVTNGIGVMPSYEGELTSEEIEAVAHYVSISAAN